VCGGPIVMVDSEVSTSRHRHGIAVYALYATPSTRLIVLILPRL